MKPIRVVEIRAARNGWVVTAFEREQDYAKLVAAVYCTMVAETPDKAAEICAELMKTDDWEQAVMIPPARPESQ